MIRATSPEAAAAVEALAHFAAEDDGGLLLAFERASEAQQNLAAAIRELRANRLEAQAIGDTVRARRVQAILTALRKGRVTWR